MALRTTVVLVFAWAIVFALAPSRTGPIGPTSAGSATGASGFSHGAWQEIRSLDRRTLLFLTLSGLAAGLSWLCYFRALQLGPASRVAPIDKLSVPLVILFAWLLLGEKLTPPTLIGGLLIIAGAIVIALG